MLVDDLFELARIDAGALTLDLREAPLGSALALSCLAALEAEARRAAVCARSATSTPTPRVRCAPEQVERVLVNLLTNALRHTPSDGAVAVIVGRPTARSR